jgi:type IV secretory pathway TraG/TraD family ATPase VirD4
MVWQDLAQIKSRFPADWATILNNSAALLAFGFGHYHAAKEYADILGLDPAQLASLKPEEAVLAMRGDGTRKISRVNYLLAPEFEGMFDPNPYFTEEPETKVEPVEPELPAPETWQEKIVHTHTVLRKFIEESRKEGEGQEEELLFGAFIHLADAVEQIGRHLPPGIEKKKPIRRKKGDRGV